MRCFIKTPLSAAVALDDKMSVSDKFGKMQQEIIPHSLIYYRHISRERPRQTVIVFIHDNRPFEDADKEHKDTAFMFPLGTWVAI